MRLFLISLTCFNVDRRISEAFGGKFVAGIKNLIQNRKVMEGTLKRDFVKVSETCSNFKFRVLQFNILADGLSGAHPDLGGFSRLNPAHIAWEYRKNRLLNEILQYEPDVITLQEVDHCEYAATTTDIASTFFILRLNIQTMIFSYPSCLLVDTMVYLLLSQVSVEKCAFDLFIFCHVYS